ncbi:Gfo/Idh/MocA family protein [Cohnella herbarum]|uniref:Gfo/Idh/MocA family oxidoreductase n=1 Tax=Cohnella herbarum TaxID=2728023 RepID=A0A7Z2VQV5_9BACL|nr:Gfo/Idh/MocA family oxidoreductase [Cohnella herbarum]QJD87479.1 Gfo/Idh/MocA family oxidoreductase [Cohnella herbarum]
MIKVAIAGCGTMGEVHAANLSRMPGVVIAGVYGRNPDALAGFASRYRTKAYDDFERMIEDTDADLVCVLLRTEEHKEYVIRAARCGKHVFCEKPIALRTEDARQMIDVCESHSVQLFIGHVLRFFPNYVDVKKHLDKGTIGDVGVIHTKRVGPHPGRAKAWYSNPAASGGVIMDLMIHDIDFLRWTIGEISSVYAVNVRRHDQDYALATMRFRNGTIANLEAHWGFPGPFQYAYEFAGNRGMIRMNSGDIQPFVMRIGTPDITADPAVAVPVNPAAHDAYYEEMAHFIACIKENRTPLISPHEAAESVAIARKAIQSALTGEPVYL